MNGDEVTRESNHQRGSSLVEVLVSMVILLFVMLGTLQLFTMALVVDRVADAQAEMTRKAHAVVEVIRIVNSTQQSGTSGVLPLNEGTRSLPNEAFEDGYDFWGPSGYGIIEENARYEIAYEVADNGPDWIVTVFAKPVTDPGKTGYVGVNPSKKGVRYAAYVPK
jgi:type II secretory pathway pseudopilin PulG